MRNHVVAVDPGERTGLAWRERSHVRLETVAYDRDTIASYVQGAAVVIIERPVIYPGTRTRNPASVMSVSIKAGEIAGLAHAAGARVVYVEPRTWGGSVPKKVKHARAQKAADTRGWSVDSRSSEHARDALGMLLWWGDE